MANFLVVLDPDADRRGTFLNAAAANLAPVPGLVSGRCDAGDAGVLWVAGPRAPVSIDAGPDRFAVIWGDAIPEATAERMTAARLSTLWLDGREAVPACFDGYHAAVAYSSAGGLRVGGDIMGLFPLYYWQQGSVVLAGSSAALFPLHPAFRFEFEPAGLAGIMSTYGLVANRSLYRGVRRVAAGHLLEAVSGTEVRERLQFTTPETDRYYDLSFPQQAEVLFETLGQVMQRHAPPDQPAGLLLSGGLDSRTLAGLLARQGTPTEAITHGSPLDWDGSGARLVARELGMAHRFQADDYSGAATSAGIKARWEHLSQGFYSGSSWRPVHRLHDAPPRVVAGYAMDMLLSPLRNSAQSTDYDVAGAFDRCFPRINMWGFPPELTGRLLGDPAIGEAIYEDLRADFTSRSRRPGRAAWQFQLKNRGRFHLGGGAWQMSFGAWPVLPVLDRSLHEVAGGMPLASLVERRLGTEVVRAHLPRLARIPLDRYSRPPFPIDPGSKDVLREALSRRLDWVLKPLGRLRTGHDPRHYHRTANINGPGWRSIRKAAEASRDQAGRFLDRSVLDQQLPGPGVTIPVTDAVRDSAKFKLLVGFLLWLGNRDGLVQPEAVDD